MMNFSSGVFAMGILVGSFAALFTCSAFISWPLEELLQPAVTIPSLVSFGSVWAALWIYFSQQNAEVARAADALMVTLVTYKERYKLIAENLISNAEKHSQGISKVHPLLAMSHEFEALPDLSLNHIEPTKLMRIMSKRNFAYVTTLSIASQTAKNISNRLYMARDEIFLEHIGKNIPSIRGSYFASQVQLDAANNDAEKFNEQISYFLSNLDELERIIRSVVDELQEVSSKHSPSRGRQA